MCVNFTCITKNKKYLVVISGPTAVGKTSLAIDLARRFNGVIVSADSRQFYTEMTIGTAKPDEAQLAAVKHYFINHKSVDELYGAGHFEKDVLNLLPELFKAQQLVFLVGGSGLYIDAVLNGVDDFIEVPNEIREALNAEFVTRGISRLQDEIERSDPDYFRSADIQNPQRLIRALEITRFSGLPYSSFLKNKKTARDFIPVKIFVNTAREKLYGQINKRVDDMMRSGLLEEVKTLVEHKHFNALKTVGYKELFDFLDGQMSMDDAVTKIKQHTRNYAKRQITWFKNKDTFVEFDVNDIEGIVHYIENSIR